MTRYTSVPPEFEELEAALDQSGIVPDGASTWTRVAHGRVQFYVAEVVHDESVAVEAEARRLARARSLPVFDLHLYEFVDPVEGIDGIRSKYRSAVIR